MRILIAEDDPISCALLEATLRKWQYEVVVARDGEEALRQMEGPEAPGLALLDWMMPCVDGAEVCRRIRAQKREPYPYLILLTAKGRKEDLVEGLEAGADDYLVKPFNREELKVRLRAGERILDLQADLIAARESLRHQATHDALTAIWNRGAILDILKKEMARSRRSRQPIGLILADLDHFKRVNDRYGHLAGDAVLREAVRRLSGTVRIYDSVGRYGGEEFLVVLPGCDETGVMTLAERLRAAVAEPAMDVPGAQMAVTCSFGALATSQAREAGQEQLLRAADMALYRAKAQGRNRVELVRPEDLAASEAGVEAVHASTV